MHDLTAQWRVPIQAAPVDRTLGAATRTSHSGVEPSIMAPPLDSLFGPGSGFGWMFDPNHPPLSSLIVY